MKKNKMIYASLMLISLVGMGIGIYFLTKKKGLVMQSENTEDEKDIVDEDVKFRPINEHLVILPVVKPFIEQKKYSPMRQHDIEIVRDFNDSREQYTYLED